jgi:hypothetical protein
VDFSNFSRTTVSINDKSTQLCYGFSPFDNVYFPSGNEPHVTVEYLNASFITQEIDRQPSSGTCPTICTDDIIGMNVINPGSTGNDYVLNMPVPTGATPHWGTSSNLSITTSLNDHDHAEVNCNSSQPGSYINIWIENPCGADVYYSKNIGTPSPKSTGVPVINDDLVSIYPNPAETAWHIHFNNINTYSLSLSNISGQVVYINPSCIEPTITIKNSELAPGLYFLKVIYSSSEKIYKIVKQ